MSSLSPSPFSAISMDEFDHTAVTPSPSTTPQQTNLDAGNVAVAVVGFENAIGCCSGRPPPHSADGGGSNHQASPSSPLSGPTGRRRAQSARMQQLQQQQQQVQLSNARYLLTESERDILLQLKTACPYLSDDQAARLVICKKYPDRCVQTAPRFHELCELFSLQTLTMEQLLGSLGSGWIFPALPFETKELAVRDFIPSASPQHSASSLGGAAGEESQQDAAVRKRLMRGKGESDEEYQERIADDAKIVLSSPLSKLSATPAVEEDTSDTKSFASPSPTTPLSIKDGLRRPRDDVVVLEENDSSIVFVIRMSRLTSSHSSQEVARGLFFATEWAMKEYPSLARQGIVLLVDVRNALVQSVEKFLGNQTLFHVISAFLNVFPVRVKRVLIYHCASVLGLAIRAVKAFLTSKLAARIEVVSNSSSMYSRVRNFATVDSDDGGLFNYWWTRHVVPHCSAASPTLREALSTAERTRSSRLQNNRDDQLHRVIAGENDDDTTRRLLFGDGGSSAGVSLTVVTGSAQATVTALITLVRLEVSERQLWLEVERNTRSELSSEHRKELAQAEHAIRMEAELRVRQAALRKEREAKVRELYAEHHSIREAIIMQNVADFQRLKHLAVVSRSDTARMEAQRRAVETQQRSDLTREEYRARNGIMISAEKARGVLVSKIEKLKKEYSIFCSKLMEVRKEFVEAAIASRSTQVFAVQREAWAVLLARASASHEEAERETRRRVELEHQQQRNDLLSWQDSSRMVVIEQYSTGRETIVHDEQRARKWTEELVRRNESQRLGIASEEQEGRQVYLVQTEIEERMLLRMTEREARTRQQQIEDDAAQRLLKGEEGIARDSLRDCESAEVDLLQTGFVRTKRGIARMEVRRSMEQDELGRRADVSSAEQEALGEAKKVFFSTLAELQSRQFSQQRSAFFESEQSVRVLAIDNAFASGLDALATEKRSDVVAIQQMLADREHTSTREMFLQEEGYQRDRLAHVQLSSLRRSYLEVQTECEECFRLEIERQWAVLLLPVAHDVFLSQHALISEKYLADELQLLLREVEFQFRAEKKCVDLSQAEAAERGTLRAAQTFQWKRISASLQRKYNRLMLFAAERRSRYELLVAAQAQFDDIASKEREEVLWMFSADPASPRNEDGGGGAAAAGGFPAASASSDVLPAGSSMDDSAGGGSPAERSTLATRGSVENSPSPGRSDGGGSGGLLRRRAKSVIMLSKLRTTTPSTTPQQHQGDDSAATPGGASSASASASHQPNQQAAVGNDSVTTPSFNGSFTHTPAAVAAAAGTGGNSSSGGVSPPWWRRVEGN